MSPRTLETSVPRQLGIPSAHALAKHLSTAIAAAAAEVDDQRRYARLRQSFTSWRDAEGWTTDCPGAPAGMFPKLLNSINQVLYALSVLNGVFEGSTLDEDDLQAYEQGLDRLQRARAQVARTHTDALLAKVMTKDARPQAPR